MKFNKSNAKSKFILDLVYSDIWESPDISLESVKYLETFIKDYSISSIQRL